MGVSLHIIGSNIASLLQYKKENERRIQNGKEEQENERVNEERRREQLAFNWMPDEHEGEVFLRTNVTVDAQIAILVFTELKRAIETSHHYEDDIEEIALAARNQKSKIEVSSYDFPAILKYKGNGDSIMGSIKSEEIKQIVIACTTLENEEHGRTFSIINPFRDNPYL